MIARSRWSSDVVSPWNRRAFSLVEILIVVVILGILAAIVLPQFTSAADQTRENSMRQDVHRIRQQLMVYAAQHRDQFPTDATMLIDQMTRASNAHGETEAPGTEGYPFGPYLRELPSNPFTGGNDVGDGDPGTSDWYYVQGDFRANNSEQHRQF